MENAKTIKDLLNAVALSDGDYLPVNQPKVYNPITHQEGDTRKLSVARFMDHIKDYIKKNMVGKSIAELINGKIPTSRLPRELTGDLSNILSELEKVESNLMHVEIKVSSKKIA